MPIERTTGGTSLIDVLDRVLDKGIVIDAWVRVSLVGIDLITVEARVVVASIDTYLKYSESISQVSPVSRPAAELPSHQDVVAERGRTGRRAGRDQQRLAQLALELGEAPGQLPGGDVQRAGRRVRRAVVDGRDEVAELLQIHHPDRIDPEAATIDHRLRHAPPDGSVSRSPRPWSRPNR